MIDPRKRQFTAIIGVIVAAIVAVVFYSNIDPAESRWVPQCTFRYLTGYECPGCGLQRALYALMHGEIAAAWRLNPYLFFVAPVGICYMFVELSGRPMVRLRRIMFSPIAVWTLVSVTILWWIVRNMV